MGTAKQKVKNRHKQPFYRKKVFLWPVGIVFGLVLVISIAFRFSPFPGAFIIRTVFDLDAHKKLQAMQAHTPSTPVSVVADQQYINGTNDAKLDVYIPQSATTENKNLPVIIWTHGGAWLSGDKTNAAPYFKLLAEKGFIVVALNYSLAPAKTYPAQIHQINSAHAYIEVNATRFHIDPSRIILAGDSAGAQLSSQIAAIVTNPVYAQEMGIAPALEPSQLAGVVLFCGIYKMEGLTQPDDNLSKIVSWGDDVTVWSYTGTRDKSSPYIQQMSAYYHTDSHFPKTFISGGNSDPLTSAQSIPFADKLKSLHVNVTTLFYEAGHQPGLPHEYQFNLDNSDGMNALEAMIVFAQEVSNS